MPKLIFKSTDHEILSTEGLVYTTAFGSVAQGATHIPSFRKPDNDAFYILVDKEYRTFQPGKTVFGFSYQQEDGTFSEPLTAIFCHIGGIEEECVVLGTFSQSHANDVFDSLSPYDDIPTGRWDFWEKYPKIFFYVKEGLELIRENMLYLTPQMVHLRFNKDHQGKIYGYGLNPETGEISSLPATATCIWIPGKLIEQTLADHEGRPLERESGVAYSKYISSNLDIYTLRAYKDIKVFPVTKDGSVSPLAESLLKEGFERLNPDDHSKVILGKKKQ